MVHDRVCHNGHIEYVFYRDARLFGGASGKLIESFVHHPGHRLIATLVHHHVRNATHQILTKSDLRVHRIGSGEHFSAIEIAQLGGNRGRAQVDGESIDFFLFTRPDADNLLMLIHGCGYLAS